MKKILLASALFMSSISPFTQAAEYVIDTQGAHAFINFKVSHLGFSWLHGRFNTFAGEFTYDAEKLAEAKISLEIDTGSVDSNHAERDKHLRSGDFLNVDKHPKATFVSSKVVPGADGHFDVIGQFTFNGVSKEITIKASKTGAGQDPWGGYRVGFHGTTEIKLTDYGIKNILGPVSETVYLDLVVEGIRK